VLAVFRLLAAGGAPLQRLAACDADGAWWRQWWLKSHTRRSMAQAASDCGLFAALYDGSVLPPPDAAAMALEQRCCARMLGSAVGWHECRDWLPLQGAAEEGEGGRSLVSAFRQLAEALAAACESQGSQEACAALAAALTDMTLRNGKLLVLACSGADAASTQALLKIHNVALAQDLIVGMPAQLADAIWCAAFVVEHSEQRGIAVAAPLREQATALKERLKDESRVFLSRAPTKRELRLCQLLQVET